MNVTNGMHEYVDSNTPSICCLMVITIMKQDKILHARIELDTQIKSQPTCKGRMLIPNRIEETSQYLPNNIASQDDSQVELPKTATPASINK